MAERHSLIVIIALGESIVAVGVGAAGLELHAGPLAAAALGVAIAAALWWAYFDDALPAVERRLRATQGRARNVMARDSFSFLHLPMVTGIVLPALGVKKTLGAVDDPLKLLPSVALCGGVALYLVADVAFRWRCLDVVGRERLLAAAACAALVPLAVLLPAVAALASLAAVGAALIVFEARRSAPAAIGS